MNPIEFLKLRRRGFAFEEKFEQAVHKKSEKAEALFQEESLSLFERQQTLMKRVDAATVVITSGDVLKDAKEYVDEQSKTLQDVKARQEHLSSELGKIQEDLIRKKLEAVALSAQFKQLSQQAKNGSSGLEDFIYEAAPRLAKKVSQS